MAITEMESRSANSGEFGALWRDNCLVEEDGHSILFDGNQIKSRSVVAKG